MFLADANVLIDIISNRAADEWSLNTVRDALKSGAVYLNLIIYAEIAATFDRPEHLDRTLEDLGVERLDMTYQVAFLASKAFIKYRRMGGTKTAPLPDFFIGAHAATEGLAVITRDARRFRTYFPDVALISPD